ncbi:MAG: hypothetical protein RLZZ63_1451 [Gemmatimonadota bacterium]
MHQVSSTRVLLVFTCCPPGPPARVAWRVSSCTGMVSCGEIHSGPRKGSWSDEGRGTGGRGRAIDFAAMTGPILPQDNLTLSERLARRWLDEWHGAAVVVALLALASSITSITNGFAYDDIPIIYDAERLHDWRQLWRVFGQTYWSGDLGKDLYRPLTLFSFGVQWAIGDGDPMVFHAVSIILYGAVALGVLALGRRVLPPRFAALGAGLWTVHPLHVEAVGNVVGQAELLVALALVGGLVLYIDARSTARWPAGRLAAIIGLFVVGLLSKEHAIVFPGLLVVIEVAMQRAGRCPRGLPPLRIRLVYWIATFVALGYLLLRSQVLSSAKGGIHPSLAFLSADQRIFAAIGFWPEIARLLLWPVRLYADYSPGLVSIHPSFHPIHVLSALLLAIWIAACWIGWRQRRAALLVGACWVPVAFSPVANLLFPTGILVAERTLFLPSVAFALIVGGVALVGVQGGRLRPAVLVGAVTALLLAGVSQSAARQRTWEDSLTVFTTLVADAPENARGHLALGQIYTLYNAWDRAEPYLRTARAIDPMHRVAYALFLSRTGRCREALPLLDSMLVQFDRLEQGHTVRVSCLLNERRFRDARRRALDGLAQGLTPAVFMRTLLLSDSLLVAYDSVDIRNRWVAERRPYDRSGRPFAVQVGSTVARPLRPMLDGGRP